MEGIKSFKKPIDRQINESLRIQDSVHTVDVVMNSGSEWRADSLTRASFGAPGLVGRREAGRGTVCGRGRRVDGNTTGSS